MFLLSLWACSAGGDVGWELEAEAPAAEVDECAIPCLSATLSLDGAARPGEAVAVSLDGASFASLSQVLTDEDGVAELCLPGASVPPGAHTLRLSARGIHWEWNFEVHPWGWDLGRVRESAVPDSLAWVWDWAPEPLPFLTPEDGSWYAMKVTSPYLMEDGYLAFSGTEAPCEACTNNPYDIGSAWVDLESWELTEVSEEPVLPVEEGAWDAGDRNGAELTGAEGDWTMWYFGRPEPDGATTIGRARSTDRRVWTADPLSPVFDGGPLLDNAAHPTIQELDSGILEMWYAGDGGIGFALSTDGGDSFTAWCGGPVMVGPGDGSLKTPEVLWIEDRYVMTYGGGTKPNYALGQAESFDGVHWLDAPDPILSPGEHPWEAVGVTNGQILSWMDEPTMIVTGTASDGGGGIGLVRGQ